MRPGTAPSRAPPLMLNAEIVARVCCGASINPCSDVWRMLIIVKPVTLRKTAPKVTVVAAEAVVAAATVGGYKEL